MVNKTNFEQTDYNEIIQKHTSHDEATILNYMTTTRHLNDQANMAICHKKNGEPVIRSELAARQNVQ